MDLDQYRRQIRKNFWDDKFIVMSNAVEVAEAEHFVNQMFLLEQEQQLHKDPQCPLSAGTYSNEIFQQLHQKFAETLGDILELKLLPTFTYCRIYKNGEVLHKHVDRDACEITASITLGYQSTDQWPLFFDGEPPDPVYLSVGEMAVYLGRDITHWRERFQGEWQVQLSLHYVTASGEFTQHHQDREHMKSLESLKQEIKRKNLNSAVKDLERTVAVIEAALGEQEISKELKTLVSKLALIAAKN